MQRNDVMHVLNDPLAQELIKELCVIAGLNRRSQA